METLSLTLALCVGNSPVTGECPSQRSVTRSFDLFFDLRLNNDWVNNHEAGDWKRHRAHYDVTVMNWGLTWPIWHAESAVNENYVNKLYLFHLYINAPIEYLFCVICTPYKNTHLWKSLSFIYLFLIQWFSICYIIYWCCKSPVIINTTVYHWLYMY